MTGSETTGKFVPAPGLFSTRRSSAQAMSAPAASRPTTTRPACRRLRAASRTSTMMAWTGRMSTAR